MESILGLGGEGFGTTRKFLDSKGAKKLAASMSKDNETREPTPAEVRNQQILDEYRERRGASLFEDHAKGNPSPPSTLFCCAPQACADTYQTQIQIFIRVYT